MVACLSSLYFYEYTRIFELVLRVHTEIGPLPGRSVSDFSLGLRLVDNGGVWSDPARWKLDQAKQWSIPRIPDDIGRGLVGYRYSFIWLWLLTIFLSSTHSCTSILPQGVAIEKRNHAWENFYSKRTWNNRFLSQCRDPTSTGIIMSKDIFLQRIIVVKYKSSWVREIRVVSKSSSRFVLRLVPTRQENFCHPLLGIRAWSYCNTIADCGAGEWRLNMSPSLHLQRRSWHSSSIDNAMLAGLGIRNGNCECLGSRKNLKSALYRSRCTDSTPVRSLEFCYWRKSYEVTPGRPFLQLHSCSYQIN